MKKPSYDNYKNRMTSVGQDVSEYKKNITKNNVEQVFRDNPNHIVVSILKPDGTVLNDYDARYLNENEMVARSFIFKPNDIVKEGDIINMTEDSSSWLVFIDYFNEVYPKAKTRKVNSVIKFKNRDKTQTFELLSHGAQRTANIREDMMDVNSPSTKADFYVQKNDTSSLIKPNMRFIVNGFAYIVETVDNVTLDNIIRLVMKTDTTKPNDDIENSIADNSMFYDSHYNDDVDNPPTDDDGWSDL